MDGAQMTVCRTRHHHVSLITLKPWLTCVIPESDISDVEDDESLDESLLDRVYALKDMIPPTYRKHVSDAAEQGYSWISSAASFSGKSLWVISTSALLLGVPWALAFSEEQQVQEMEREMRMQQSANEVSNCTLSVNLGRVDPDSILMFYRSFSHRVWVRLAQSLRFRVLYWS